MSNQIKNYTPISTASSSDKHEHITAELQRLENALHDADIPHELWEKANMQLQRINLAMRYGGNVNQLDMISQYVDWVTSLPWEKSAKDQLDIEAAKRILEERHYGLGDIKQRILEYISVLIMQRNNKELKNPHAPVLFFVGLAGTGKTSFAKAIADSLGRPFARIPFGGLSSPLDLRGLSKVQPEAEPGQVLKAIRRAGVNNPVILLDELDRVTEQSRGAIMGILLELLDPQQNNHFVDHYIDYPFDLSQVVFVATANNTQTISTAVLDRLEVIQMPSYSDEEKIKIARDFIMPRMMRESGLPENSVIVDDVVWQQIARLSGYDPGIRSVERKVESIIRTAAYKIVSGSGNTFKVTSDNMGEFIK